MKFWIQYIRERKITIFVYIVTVALFVIVGILYRVEDADMFIYPAILSFVVLLVAGLINGFSYLNRRKAIEKVLACYDEDRVLKIDGLTSAYGDSLTTGLATSENQALTEVLLKMNDCVDADKNRADQKAQDARNYYLMWAHQIKTPIAAMRLLLEDDENNKNSFLMKEELIKIEQYVEMGLEFQRIDNMENDLSLAKYSVKDMIRQVVKKYSLLFINKGLSVNMPEDDFDILTDEKWFCFCLGQLLSNSIKYTSIGSITFTLQKSDDKVKMILTDTGIGIRTEDIPRICEKGFTGYNGRLDKKATGVGLFICKEVFDRIGIEMKVESELSVGTSVILTCPTENKRNFD